LQETIAVGPLTQGNRLCWQTTWCTFSS